MVEVRASRIAIETLADEDTWVTTTRSDQQVIGTPESATEVRASRVNIEVLASEESWIAATRSDNQVIGTPGSPTEVRASRVAIEVLAGTDQEAATTRVDNQVAGGFGSVTEVRASRVSLECLARQGSAGPVVPEPLIDDAVIFLHNWASRCQLRTSFQTSLGASPASGAESRRGLNVKPFRTMTLQWLLCDETSLEDLERMEVFFRRIGNARFQMPIYPDQQELTSAILSSDTVIPVATREGRFFPGARVALVEVGSRGTVDTFSFHQIDTLTNDSITLTAAVGGSGYSARAFIFPVMDCEIQLEVEADLYTARVPEVNVTVAEAPGDSQLPPLKSDTPTGAETYDGKPIWFEEPNWSVQVTKGRRRQGNRSRDGRADHVVPEATRSRQYHEYQIAGARADMFKALEFFETRRGRLRTFWHIDQDQYFTAASITPAGDIVGVDEIGTQADFEEELDYIGFVLNDGRIFVREAVTVNLVSGVFEVTMDNPVDTDIDFTTIIRIARARFTRFDRDEFVEDWRSTGFMSTKVAFIEALTEQDFGT